METFMKVMIVIIVIVMIIVCASSCTEQSVTKNLGGTMEIELEPGEKLEEITWKDGNLWYLTRPMRDDETAETHEFVESSEFGVCEGKVVIIEKVKK